MLLTSVPLARSGGGGATKRSSYPGDIAGATRQLRAPRRCRGALNSNFSVDLSYKAGPTNPFLLSAGSSVQKTDENACVPERPICTLSGREPMS
jgi:hypothetical protein